MRVQRNTAQSTEREMSLAQYWLQIYSITNNNTHHSLDILPKPEYLGPHENEQAPFVRVVSRRQIEEIWVVAITKQTF